MATKKTTKSKADWPAIALPAKPPAKQRPKAAPKKQAKAPPRPTRKALAQQNWDATLAFMQTLLDSTELGFSPEKYRAMLTAFKKLTADEIEELVKSNAAFRKRSADYQRGFLEGRAEGRAEGIEEGLALAKVHANIKVSHGKKGKAPPNAALMDLFTEFYNQHRAEFRRREDIAAAFLEAHPNRDSALHGRSANTVTARQLIEKWIPKLARGIPLYL